jgi:hypothetical protein
MNASDKAKLTAALNTALAEWQALNPAPSLLHAPPQDILGGLAPKIRACTFFQAVEGSSIYSGNAGFVLHAESLAWPLLSRIIYDDRGLASIPDAVAWFEKLLTTDKAEGRFIAPIWGLTVDSRVRITGDTYLVPFDQLPDSIMKRRVRAQAQALWNGACWIGQRYFDKPGAAIIKRVRRFPYFGRPDLSAKKIFLLESEVASTTSCLEAVFTRQPLVAGSWFEYEDHELDINAHENYLTWHVPEVEPYIDTATAVTANQVRQDIEAFLRLDGEWRDKIVRSINRFSLSQCRRNPGDKIIDQALAFEILLADENKLGAPIGWLVGLRGAQFINGTLDERKTLRNKINNIYKLRNKAAHGGRLRAKEAREIQAAFDEAAEVYGLLMSRCLSVVSKPDWQSLELQP